MSHLNYPKCAIFVSKIKKYPHKKLEGDFYFWEFGGIKYIYIFFVRQKEYLQFSDKSEGLCFNWYFKGMPTFFKKKNINGTKKF